jgi:VWFA-related protein
MRPKAIPRPKTLALVLLLTCLLTASAQDLQIRTRVDLVVVPVSVKNNDDELITGLTKNDFNVYEDGKPQSIASFSVDPVAISAAILVDTGLSEADYEKVFNSFPALAGAFSDFDEVMVYRFDKFVTKVLDSTDDKLLVASALRKLDQPAPARNPGMTSGPFSANGPVINGIPVIPGGPDPPHSRAYAPGAKILHDAIFMAADELGQRTTDRRKIILVVSDGQSRGDEHSFKDSINRLVDFGIEVYAIGMDEAFLSRKFSVLNAYADQSGGAACFLNSQHAMERCYARLTEEARNQYVLGYVSNNEPPAQLPVFREIDVRGRSGLEMNHKKGYFQYP